MEHGRRSFVVSALMLLVAPPVHAQPGRARIAMLLTGSPAVAAPEYAAFTQQLRELGWSEGQNLMVDRRWADAPDAFSALAVEAVRARSASAAWRARGAT